MRSLWDAQEASRLTGDLAQRVYSSNLLGADDRLVLHGGGNTSIKLEEQGEEILYVKGSGWDLATIQVEGFAPVRRTALLEMLKVGSLTDTEMVKRQRAAMLNPTAPNPSVEAILHALIPFDVVDHTHADAIVTISNSLHGRSHLAQLFPDFLIVPYVMPGFVLAEKVHQMTQDLDWDRCGGIILEHHGIFTFDHDVQASYEKMIEAVSRAEAFLDEHAPLRLEQIEPHVSCHLERVKQLIENAKGHKVVMKVNQTLLALKYAANENLEEFATRGVLTPEHILRTKHQPLIVEDNNIEEALTEYMQGYTEYFETFASGKEVMLNPAPNYVVIKDFGVLVFGRDEREANIINDIVEHTMMAVLRADKLGGYVSISLEESFAMEYWELEQAKLK